MLLNAVHDENEPTVSARQVQAEQPTIPNPLYKSAEQAFVANKWWSSIAFGNRESRMFTDAFNLTQKDGHDYVVPASVAGPIVELRQTFSCFERYARRVAMDNDVVDCVRVLGDTDAGWVAPENEITSSDMTLGSVELSTAKLAAITTFSSELEQDATTDLAALLTRSGASAMAEQIDRAAFLGDGTLAYGGFVGLANALDSAAINDAATGNTGALTTDAADWEATAGLLVDYFGAQNRWYMHRKIYFAGPARVLPSQCELIAGEHHFMGIPVTFVNVMPSETGASASSVIAYCGDLALSSTFGYRNQIRVARTKNRLLEIDNVRLRLIQRCAVVNHERGDSEQNRPIVALKTAAS